MTDLLCPSCGSEKVKIQQMNETRQLTLGAEFSYEVPIHVCEDCGEEGDFNGVGDSYRETAIEEAKKDLAVWLINEIQNSGMKLSYVERALELPQRTISSKWRTGISASGLALLRIVKSMPWIVHIADNKFTNEAIGQEIVKVFTDNGATFESSYGAYDTFHMKITRAVEGLNATVNLNEAVSTGT